MSENNSTRKPAPELLQEFLSANKISILISRQSVRFLEDNGIVIEPPRLMVVYNSEMPQKKSNVDLPGRNN